MTARTMSWTILLTIIVTTSVCSADCNSGDRYEDNLNGTVTDCRTGLIWLKNAYCAETSGGIGSVGFLDWSTALRWVAGLGNGVCGLTDGSSSGDWRLPAKTEWMAMVANAKKQILTGPALTKGSGVGKWTPGDIFDNVPADNFSNYWTATPDSSDQTWIWIIHSFDGSMALCNKADQRSIWPVRGGQTGSFGHLSIE